jgi:hypothetical protein
MVMQSGLYAPLDQASNEKRRSFLVLGAYGGARIDQAGAVRVGEGDRLGLRHVAVTGVSRGAVEGRRRAGWIVRAHEVRQVVPGASFQPPLKRLRPAAQIAARREHEGGDTHRVG